MQNWKGKVRIPNKEMHRQVLLRRKNCGLDSNETETFPTQTRGRRLQNFLSGFNSKSYVVRPKPNMPEVSRVSIQYLPNIFSQGITLLLRSLIFLTSLWKESSTRSTAQVKWCDHSSQLPEIEPHLTTQLPTNHIELNTLCCTSHLLIPNIRPQRVWICFQIK